MLNSDIRIAYVVIVLCDVQISLSASSDLRGISILVVTCLLCHRTTASLYSVIESHKTVHGFSRQCIHQ